MNLPGPMHSDSRQRGAGDLPGAGESAANTLLRAWQAGQELELESFVAGRSDVAPRDLGALIRLDFAARWQRNDRTQAEEYLRRFPVVAADPELALDVIYSEYLAREQAGERPELAEYQARFPEIAQVLSQQIRLHDAFETLENDESQDGPSATEPAAGDWFPSAASSSTLAGSYEIVEQIGSGGMGVVYKAHHAALDRFVALKMLRAVDAGNPELLARIRAEARVVAALHHPHIVQVYDFGEHAGQPYIAMEFVGGGSLADRLDGSAWPPREAAALLTKLADAVQFAHEHHVIHRDLKPANVLIAAADAKGLDVKISDFGLAKLCMDEASSQTRSYTFLGTPSYMPPEQAKGQARDLGPTADIYSLGAILYELLTGQPPFRGDSPLETLRLLLSSEPVSIHRHAARISRDLATICDKCLQGDPRRRYVSAAELRADLERYLDGRPIQARPVGNTERLWRWCRRNPPLAVALGSVAALLVGISLVSLWFSAQLRQELTLSEAARQAERAANRTAQQRMWDAYLSEAVALNNSRQVGQRFAALKSVDKAIALREAIGKDADRDRQLRNVVLSSAILPDLRTVRALDEWHSPSSDVAMSATADCYVAAAPDGTLFAFRISDGRKLWTIQRSGGRATPILSRDGQLLAAINDRGTTVWRTDSGEPTMLWQAGPADHFAFAPDGEHAVCSNRQQGMRWIRIEDGAVVRSVGRGPAQSAFVFHAPTSRMAVCGSGSVQVIATSSGEIEAELPLGPAVAVEPRIAWHPSGESLAIWGDVEGISLWDIRSGAATLNVTHHGIPARLCFTEDGSILATHSLWDRRLLVWDVATGQRLLEVPEAISGACDAAPERRILFLISLQGKYVMAELTAGACRTLAQAADVPLGYWHKVSVSPEGRIVAFSSQFGLELWDLQTARRLLARKFGPCLAVFDQAGRLFVGCNAGVFRLPCHTNTHADSGPGDGSAVRSAALRTVVTFGRPDRLTGPIAGLTMGVNASGETIVFQDDRGWAVVGLSEDATVRRLQTRDDPRISAVSNDNRCVAIANWEAGGAAVWDIGSGSLLAELAIGRHGVVQFSPDGRLLAATPEGVTLWRTDDWRRISELHAQGTTPAGLGIAFSPDSRVLAVGQINGVLGLFDPLTGDLWASLSSGDFNSASILAFSPDQRWLIAASHDERSPAQVWDLVAMRSEIAKRGLDLPADVLRAAEVSTPFDEQLDVVMDDDQLFIEPSTAK